VTQTTSMPKLRDAAHRYLDAELSVLPARKDAKFVSLKEWKPYQKRRPIHDEIDSLIDTGDSLCVICGAVSGNLEMIDFDLEAELFERWFELVEEAAPGLASRLYAETTQSGGRHLAYRCVEPVEGNKKLAQREVERPNGDEFVYRGKKVKPRKKGGRWIGTLTFIETRGEGGLFLCDPSPGYVALDGDLTTLPTVTAAERAILLDTARSLNEAVEIVEPRRTRTESDNWSVRPGDDFKQRGDIRPFLKKHDWSKVCDGKGDNEYWRRPGKHSYWSATWNGQVFYVFSSNAAPFEGGHGYSAFAVYALLEHDGDWTAATAALHKLGYGVPKPSVSRQPAEAAPPSLSDPGTVPVELLRAPGFVSAVMDFTLQTAPYPNPALAFCGAMALQSFLCGRIVRDEANVRSNIYLLGLAHSAAGKERPRAVNVEVLTEIELLSCIGESIASGEGLQDALKSDPVMLVQTDEIDGVLQAIKASRDGRYESLLRTLLTIYSAANSVYPMRRKAGQKHPGCIHQPSLTLFGTAIPNHYYDALSGRLLTNGFFARTLIIESGPRGCGQDTRPTRLPAQIVDTAQQWAKRQPLDLDARPEPAVISSTDAGAEAIMAAREQADHEYAAAEKANDDVATTVWGRMGEQVRKLALLYACSEKPDQPEIDAPGVRWATDLVMHQIRRMLFMASERVADSPFDALCLKAVQHLRRAEGHELGRSQLLRAMKLKAKDFDDLIETMVEQGTIDVREEKTPGRLKSWYSLRRERRGKKAKDGRA